LRDFLEHAELCKTHQALSAGVEFPGVIVLLSVDERL